MDRVGYIYTLSDPRTNKPKYVGATVDPNHRLRSHLNRPHSDDLASWIQELAEQDMTPDMNIVQIDDVEELEDVERRVLERVASEHEVLNADMDPSYAGHMQTRTRSRQGSNSSARPDHSHNLERPADTTQTLIETRCEHPLSDDRASELIERLSDDGELTENQAEWLVRSQGQQQTVEQIADALAVSTSRVYNLERETAAKLGRIDEMLAAIQELRDEVRPEPHIDD